MNRKDVAALVAIIATIWPNAPQYRSEHAEAFLWILEDCDAEDVKRALAAYVKEDQAFPPNAGQLYKRVADITDPVPEWGAAWQEALDWVHKHGWPDPPKPDSFSHRAIYVAVMRIGYEELCQSKTSEAGVWQGHFRRIYDGAKNDHKLAPARAEVEAARWHEAPLELPESEPETQ